MTDLTVSFLFDLDGTLADSVYQHVLAWHEALQEEGIELSIFLTAASIESDLGSTLLGAGLGLLVALGAGWLIFSSSIRLQPRGFFAVTSVILISSPQGWRRMGHEFNELGSSPV
jgi:hypothetical protein